MFGAKTEDGAGIFASDAWTVTEQRRRPLPAATRSLSRSASSGAALRAAALHATGHGPSRLRPAGKSASVLTVPLSRCASHPSLSRPPLAEAAVRRLVVGQTVSLHGLAKAPELNGALGVCEKWDDDAGRWMVHLDSKDDRTVAVRPENLSSAPVASASVEENACCNSESNLHSSRSHMYELSEEERRKLCCTRLAVPRRRLLVEKTLEVVRDAFDPTEGLEQAAAAAAHEVLSRTEEAQRETSTLLAQPRPAVETCFEENPPVVFRTRIEQQEWCDKLSRPRVLPAPSPAGTTLAGPTRNVLEQQKRCAELAQPRVSTADPDDSQLSSLNAAWHSLLAARDGPPPEGLAEAKDWLASRACYFASTNDGPATSASSAPPSPRRCDSGHAAADPAALRELKEVVEELLWVVLLQLRCCPKPGAANSKVLEERLCNLLLSSTGPTLRPIARRVLGPGTGLVRRLRTEFPRLSLHLGFRDSEDPEPIPAAWSAEEIGARVRQVRACRDELLANDLTKALMARLGQNES